MWELPLTFDQLDRVDVQIPKYLIPYLHAFLPEMHAHERWKTEADRKVVETEVLKILVDLLND